MEEKNFPAVSFDEFEPTSYEAWKAEAESSLKGADFNKKLFTKTYEGITLHPIYTQKDVDAINQVSSFPGSTDYLRGVDAAGYLAEPWAIAQAVKAVCPKKANEEVLHELEKGATAVNLTIGDKGVKVETAEDVKTLFAGVDLTKVSVQLDCGASSLKVLELMAAAGIDLKALKGCVGGDIFGTLLADGMLTASVADLYDAMAKGVKLASGARTVYVNGNVYANGGANAVQEIAYCMATAVAYINALVERGVDVDTAASSIRFGFSLGSNFFMEIAKIRAARMVFAQIVAAFGGSEEAQKINVFARTSSFTKTVFDPYVNILRSTTETFSGVVGGINALEVAPLDEPFGSSDEQTKRIARNIQVMMQNEFNLLQPVDPAGGSWYVETITAELANAIWTKFQGVEAAGGIEAVIANGSVQDDVAAVLAERFQKLDTRADSAVGTNMYPNVLEKKLERPAVEAPVVTGTPVVTAKKIEAHRWTERFEALRERTLSYEARTGKTVDIFLANMGPIPQHKARADFAAGFFEVAHFNMLRNNGFETVEACADAAVKSGAPVAVICSTDATYPELVPALTKAIKAQKPDMTVMVAGAPAAEYKDAYLAAGVDDFVHVKANCYDILTKIQNARGIN
jgi:methylmalonyl-CoA mutase